VIAAAESLDTLVDFGNAFLRRRRMHARGGSNSTVSFLGKGATSAVDLGVGLVVSDCWDVIVGCRIVAFDCEAHVVAAREVRLGLCN
jgi:hypothetical protein